MRTEVDCLLSEAESQPVQGWDFSWLGDRISTEPLPWSYDEIVSTHARRSPDLLDMETGGGEWLSRLPNRPPRTVATESWPPNLEMAGGRLRPLGITVVWAEAAPDNVHQQPGEKRGRLPFAAESFALVTNRHASFVANEVARVLIPGGTLLTEQVGGDYGEFCDTLEVLRPDASRPPWDVRAAAEQIEAAGLRVAELGEGTEATAFADVGALAWYLKAIPWVIRGFTIEAYRPQLERLEERIHSAGPIRVRQPAFWLKAVKPGHPPT